MKLERHSSAPNGVPVEPNHGHWPGNQESYHRAVQLNCKWVHQDILVANVEISSQSFIASEWNMLSSQLFATSSFLFFFNLRLSLNFINYFKSSLSISLSLSLFYLNSFKKLPWTLSLPFARSFANPLGLNKLNLPLLVFSSYCPSVCLSVCS